MNSWPPSPVPPVAGEISRLIETMLAAEGRLVELTSGEVDAVAGPDGRTFLLRRAQEQLRQAEAAKQAAILDALPAHIALLDPQGIIVSVNGTWRQFAQANSLAGPEFALGVSYLETCDRAGGAHSAEAHRTVAGIRAVLAGAASFSIEYPCHAPAERRWFLMTVTPLNGGAGGAVIMHVNITERKRAEDAIRESEARFRGTFEQAAVGIAHVSPEGRFLRVNDKLCAIVGYDRAELLAMSFAELTVEEDLARSHEARRALEAGEITTYSTEKRYRRKDGTAVWTQLTAAVEKNSAGKPEYFISVFQDITERRQAEAALQRLSEKTERRERTLTTLLSSTSDFAYIYDREGRFQFVNQPLLALWGLTLEEVLGKNFFDLGYPPALATQLLAEVQSVFETGRNVTGETPYTNAAGVAGYYEYIFSPALAADGSVDFVVGTTRDITARRQSEEALRESEAALRFLNDLGVAKRVLVDPEQIIAVTTRMLGEHLGASRCAYADMAADGDRFTIRQDYTDGCASAVGEYQLADFGPRARATLASGQTLIIRDVVAELLPAEGAQVLTAIGINAIITCPLIRDGVLRALMAVHQTTPRDWRPAEITLVQEVVTRCWTAIERWTAEQHLRKSEQRFKALFEQAAVGVAQTDAVSGRYLQVNRRFCEIVGRGREAMEHLTFSDITHPQDVGHSLEMTRQLRDGSIREYTEEKRYVQAGRADVWAMVTVSAMWTAGEAPDFFIVVAQDITQRKQLEDQLRQAHKMEAIGTLAGGIAHDFNNILSAIGGYTELARLQLADNAGVRTHLDAVLQGVKRAANLVRQILTFSREQPIERRLISLPPVVAECVKLLRGIVPPTIELEMVASADAPDVLADETQVHQILMNLGTNARHALKDRPGRIQMKIERCVVDAAQAAVQSQVRAGVYALVSVSDTGKGMDANTVRRIFEPFFTTKAPGEGTGLGLAVVHGIMNSHDGAITVSSRLGEGTLFQLYFPAAAAVGTVGAEAAPSDPRGQGERILFVDDEDWLGQLAERQLRGLGYEVEVTRQPATALALVKADPQRFALVITDQAMPGMSGLQLAGELRLLRPDLPIILSTGYSLTVTPERARAAGISQLLVKPVTILALASAVRAALSKSTLPLHAANPSH